MYGSKNDTAPSQKGAKGKSKGKGKPKGKGKGIFPKGKGKGKKGQDNGNYGSYHTKDNQKGK
eukprot:12411267-Karenia_brevis.AAC.1